MLALVWTIVGWGLVMATIALLRNWFRKRPTEKREEEKDEH